MSKLRIFAVATVLYCWMRAPFIGQWDSFDYLKQILMHRTSDLGFGRPVFNGFNILLWEALKRAFNLGPLNVESVVMAEVILLGAAGVVIFSGFARRLFSPPETRMATAALLLSPIYAVYSGYIMTEIPMLVSAVAAASILWPERHGRRSLRDLCAGALFGIAVGVREQAITLGAAYVWLLWVRREPAGRLWSLIRFGLSAAAVIIAPIAFIYLQAPVEFHQRLAVWLRAIPMGPSQFSKNVQASLLYTFLICPGAWLCVVRAWFSRTSSADRPGIPAPFWGAICCIVVPIAALWRDADIQIHPRYALIALPGALIFCVALYRRWAPSGTKVRVWMAVHLLTFGAAQLVIQPLRQMQTEKREFSAQVVDTIPGNALIIPGGYSPILDYYRIAGVRPKWSILWSGWGWDAKAVEMTIRDAWRRGKPVYLCNGPRGWLYFEDELLDLYFLFKSSRRTEIARGISLISPP